MTSNCRERPHAFKKNEAATVQVYPRAKRIVNSIAASAWDPASLRPPPRFDQKYLARLKTDVTISQENLGKIL